jgi:hypothetical protein
MDLRLAGDSDYTITGIPDTQTPASDGPTGTDVVAACFNGSLKAIVTLQQLLGNALLLKGTKADLVTRLQRLVDESGTVRKGVAFPTVPPPEDGDIFWRSDQKTIYFFNSAIQQWITVFGGAGGVTLLHSALSGLTTDDHPQYVLTDGTRLITGPQSVKASTPAFRIIGTEAQAKDFQFVEAAGVAKIQKNTGTEAVPIWTDAAFSVPPLIPPSGTGTGSSYTHEGAVTIASNQNLSGVHFYTDFVLNSGITITIPSGKHCLVIVASGSITINGIITGVGAGQAALRDGTGQNGGGGGPNSGQGTSGTNGGACRNGGYITVPAGSGGNAVQTTSSDLLRAWTWFGWSGGAGGGNGSGGDSAPGIGGNGGADIVLIAPTIVLAGSAALITSGGNGSTGGSGGDYGGGGGGGGGAGNVWIVSAPGQYTDNGATLTMTGGVYGAGGGGNVANGNIGGLGAAGVKMILFYSTFARFT